MTTKAKKETPPEIETTEVEDTKTPEVIKRDISSRDVEREEEHAIAKQCEDTIPQLYNEAQRRLALNQTPLYVLRQRKGKGGLYFPYVDVGYMIEQMNLLFGHRWTHKTHPNPKQENWHMIVEQYLKMKQIIVSVEVWAPDKLCEDGWQKHESFGRADIKYLKGTNDPLDIGNDFKAAESDGLKRAISRFGIALDVYSGVVKRRQDREHPEAPITEEQRKRLEVLAGKAKMGHSGLKKLIAEQYDYTSTTDIQRRHFQPLQELLSAKVDEADDLEIPENIQEGFNFLAVPIGKQKATIRSWMAKYPNDWQDQLLKKINSEIDKKAST